MGYTIAKDSPESSRRAQVDGIELSYGDDPVDLTDEQVKRLQDADIKLEKDGGVVEPLAPIGTDTVTIPVFPGGTDDDTDDEETR